MFYMSITQAWERSVSVKLAFLSKCFHSLPRWPPLVSCFINQIETRISFFKRSIYFLFYVYASFTCMYVCIPFMYCLSRSEGGSCSPWTGVLGHCELESLYVCPVPPQCWGWTTEPCALPLCWKISDNCSFTYQLLRPDSLHCCDFFVTASVSLHPVCFYFQNTWKAGLVVHK